MHIDTDSWYAPSEVARLLGCPEDEVLKRISLGTLSAVRVRDHWCVSPVALRMHLTAAPPAPLEKRPRLLRHALAALALVATGVAGSQLLAATPAASAESFVIPYRGYLETSGEPAEGTKELTFQLFAAPDSADPLWTETHVAETAAGHFAVNLGTESSLDAVLASGGSLYVGIGVQDLDVNGDPIGDPVALAGRQLLGAVPFARRGAPASDFQVDGTLEVSGDLSLQNARPERSLATGLQSVEGAGSVFWYEGDLQFKSGAVGPAGDRMTLLSDGRVGLGTVTPEERLHVNGNAVVAGSIAVGSFNAPIYEARATSVGHFAVTATCGTGGTLLGGGCYDGGFLADGGCSHTALVANYPQNRTTWRCGSRDIDFSCNRTLTAYAICTK